jgi:2-C-methyl-D-erythritol 2,4-cyclodiphosphate synthase
LGIRAGLGYDIHKLEGGRKLFLGGVEIPFSQGLIGHSDGDCLIHSLIDALLGASGKGDIGGFFPDTDPQYKDIRSTKLLEKVVAKITAEGLKILNVDTIIITEKPKLQPYVEQMKETLSSLLRIGASEIGIKAKTKEGLGLVGEGKAISSWAIVLVRE